MALEFWAGKAFGSLMLYSDAFHMLSHSLSLLIALIGIYLGMRWRSRGQQGINPEWMASLINAVGLLVFIYFLIEESILRLYHPESIEIGSTAIIASFGLVINLLTAWILNLGGIEDLNTKGAYLHMLADTFSSVAILIGLLVMHYTSWHFIDPLLSLIVCLVIGKWAFSLIWSVLKAYKTQKLALS